MPDNTRTILVIGGLAIAGYGAYKLLAGEGTPEQAASIYGTVVDSETLQAIGGINVRIAGVSKAVTDSNGEFLVENINPGTYSLTFTDSLGRYDPYEY